MASPKNALLNGVQVLDPVLSPNGFQFRFRGEGKGSGGYFAFGEYVREDRRLELHFRHSLGLVTYHFADQSASHESYMRELGVWEQCRYPGFSDDAAAPFHGLAHDLEFAKDFLSGSAAVLRAAAAKEALDVASRSQGDMARYVGDVRQIEQIRSRFREREYGDVVVLASALKYPDRMSESERRMVEIARKRSSLAKSFFRKFRGRD